jgi:hypothetical protein
VSLQAPAATEALREALEAAYRAPSFTPPPPGGLGANIARGLSLLLGFVAGRYLTSEGELNLLKDTGQVPGYVTLGTMQDASKALDWAGGGSAYPLQDLSPGQRGQFLLGAASLGRRAGSLSSDQMRQALGELHRAVSSGQLPAPARPPAAQLPAAAPPAPRPPASLGGPEPVPVPPVPIAPPVTAPPPPRIDTATLTLGDRRFTLVTDGAGWAVDLPDGRRFGLPGAADRPDAAEYVKNAWLAGDVPGLKPPESGLQMGGRQFQIRGANGTYGLEAPNGTYLGRIHAPDLPRAAEIAKTAFLDGALPGNKPPESGLEMGGSSSRSGAGARALSAWRPPTGATSGRSRACRASRTRPRWPGERGCAARCRASRRRPRP